VADGEIIIIMIAIHTNVLLQDNEDDSNDYEWMEKNAVGPLLAGGMGGLFFMLSMLCRISSK